MNEMTLLGEHRGAIAKATEIRKRHRRECYIEYILEQKQLCTIAKYLKPAKTVDYAKWLKGYLRLGKEPTSYIDFDLPEEFFVATGDFTLPSGLNEYYHSTGLNIIVPENVTVILPDDIGGCRVFFLKDYSVCGGKWVPCYNDVAVLVAS